MTIYVIRYANYLEDFEISDFATDAEAEIFMKAQPDEPEWTITKVSGPAGLTRMAPVLRRDIWNLICAPGEDTDFETAIGAEILFDRIEQWMKE